MPFVYWIPLDVESLLGLNVFGKGGGGLGTPPTPALPPTTTAATPLSPSFQVCPDVTTPSNSPPNLPCSTAQNLLGGVRMAPGGSGGEGARIRGGMSLYCYCDAVANGMHQAVCVCVCVCVCVYYIYIYIYIYT